MVRASELNLSIIIIGMGDSPFEKMNEYKDLVRYPLVTPEGEVKLQLRSMISFQKYRNDIAKELL